MYIIEYRLHRFDDDNECYVYRTPDISNNQQSDKTRESKTVLRKIDENDAVRRVKYRMLKSHSKRYTLIYFGPSIVRTQRTSEFRIYLTIPHGKISSLGLLLTDCTTLNAHNARQLCNAELAVFVLMMNNVPQSLEERRAKCN